MPPSGIHADSRLSIAQYSYSSIVLVYRWVYFTPYLKCTLLPGLPEGQVRTDDRGEVLLSQPGKPWISCRLFS